MPIPAIIGAAVTIGKGIADIIKKSKPTPEQQRAKAGVWYDMLKDWVKNRPTIEKLISNWQDRYPFKSKNTKKDFSNNELRARPGYDAVVDTLVGKINDELRKAGDAELTPAEILQGMGVVASNSSVGSVTPSISLTNTSGAKVADVADDKEAEKDGFMYLYIVGGMTAIAALIAWAVWPKRRKRRR